ncbi:MAG: peptidylprolyl isomerase, partial [Erysipelotrichaceae bacterium]|nr:peptidylprolyl isomerase [Erysipelotrichaceae bacterium]
EQLYKDYVLAHLDELLTDHFLTEHKPRMISYTLIKMDKPATPTEEEQKRLDEAKEAWASGTYTFADFAKKYSEDSSTASTGGVLGYVDKDSSLVTDFLNAALALEEGQISDWVYSSDYGYFLIKCDSTKVDDFKNETDFISAMLATKENLQAEIIWKTAQDLGFSATEEVEKLIKKSLNLAEEEAE